MPKATQTMPVDHHRMTAYALCWPNDPIPLLYKSREVAEQDRKWFLSNYKLNREGQPRGEPFIVGLRAVKQEELEM